MRLSEWSSADHHHSVAKTSFGADAVEQSLNEDIGFSHREQSGEMQGIEANKISTFPIATLSTAPALSAYCGSR